MPEILTGTVTRHIGRKGDKFTGRRKHPTVNSKHLNSKAKQTLGEAKDGC